MVELRIGRRQRGPVRPLAVMAVAALGMVMAGCGSSTKAASAGGATTTVPSASSANAGSGTTVDTTNSPGYGTILVDSSGHTLYVFTADTAKTSACTGACPAVWPPLLVSGTPTAGPGVKSSLLSTITRSNGTHQVTYAGHPLYTFTKDQAAGQVNGEGINHFGGTWYVLGASGQPVTTASSSSPTTASSSSPTTASSGYNY